MALPWYGLSYHPYLALLMLCQPGVSLFFAVRGIAAELRRVRELTEIKQVEKEDRIISEGTEDGECRALFV